MSVTLSTTAQQGQRMARKISTSIAALPERHVMAELRLSPRHGACWMGYDQPMVSLDKTRPSRSYIPWFRWLFTLAAAFLLVVAVRPDFPVTIRVAAAGIALLAVLTHRPIHQKFVLVDSHATVLMCASADWIGNVSVRLESNDQAHVVKLGRIGFLTRQMHFEASFGDVTRTFSLGHLTNTRYFLLGEAEPLNVDRAVVRENVFCF
jgi:hypothetical protein